MIVEKQMIILLCCLDASHYMRSSSIPSNIAAMNRLLNRTLLEKNCYKKILSENGEKQLTPLKYDVNKIRNKRMCNINGRI